MAATKLWLVVKQDMIITATGYIVRAHSKEDAEASVDAGMYIEETKAEVLDTIESTTVDVCEMENKEMQRKRNPTIL